MPSYLKSEPHPYIEVLLNKIKEGSTFINILTETTVSTSAEVVSASTTFKNKNKRSILVL